MARRAPHVTVTSRQRPILEQWVRGRKTAQRLVQRARVVLLSAEGMTNGEQAGVVGVEQQFVGRWRKRWAAAQGRLAAAEAEGASNTDLQKLICGVLSDKRRSGTRPKFSPEQVTDIIALACESSGDSGLPISHWTPADLAPEAIKRGIVDSISPRHLDRFFKRSRPQTAQEPLLAHVA